MPVTIQDVKAKHEKQLLSRSGVISIGIGLDAAGNPVIVIGVESDDTATKSTLPQELDGFPVQTRVIGTPRAQ